MITRSVYQHTQSRRADEQADCVATKSFYQQTRQDCAPMRRRLFDIQRRLSTDTQSWRADEQAECLIFRSVCQSTHSPGASICRPIV